MYVLMALFRKYNAIPPTPKGIGPLAFVLWLYFVYLHCCFASLLGRMALMTKKRSQFIVRTLRPDTDFAACAHLDHAYTTDHVWQMDLREEQETVLARFRTVRLPRMMDVPYPHDPAALSQRQQPADCFLVAATGDNKEIVLGYVHMRVDATHPATGWINDLVVGKAFRRRKIGSALLEQAQHWAQLHTIRQIRLEMQTKNYPAIQFAQTHGFVFCGFNDHYYANQDIALFFTKTI